MGKQKQRSNLFASFKQVSPTSESPQDRLQTLIKQHKYQQALDEIKKIRRTQPDFAPNPSEADIWLLRGQQEWERNQPRQAEAAFRRSLELGLQGESHYWLARCLLATNRLDEAIALMKQAFGAKLLPAAHQLSYVKLLFLKNDLDTIEQLIKPKSTPFTAEQLQWIRGVLALKHDQPEVALTHFQKLKHPISNGDRPKLWQAYAQQCSGDWEAAAKTLGTDTAPKTSLFQTPFAYTLAKAPPILRRLAIFQLAQTGRLSAMLQAPDDLEDLVPEAQQRIALVQLLIECLEREKYAEAGYAFLSLGSKVSEFPELQQQRRSILTQAGQNALDQEEPEIAVELWSYLLQDNKTFDPHLAVNLSLLYRELDEPQERQKILSQLLRWLERNPLPQGEAYHQTALAHTHCYLADLHAIRGRWGAAQAEVKKAVQIAPEDGEVIGRRGLLLVLDDRHAEGIPLLTTALEKGCRSFDVYKHLIDYWKDQGDRTTCNDIRKRFGAYFGDHPEMDVESLPTWVLALGAENFTTFEIALDTNSKDQSPALKACRILASVAQPSPQRNARRVLQRELGQKRWDELLSPLAPADKIEPLQAIVIGICKFVKREKGLVDVINRYLKQLEALANNKIGNAPEAYLVALAIKATSPQQLEKSLNRYLATAPQPGNALAKIQLNLRRFGWNRMIIPSLKAALEREPQNPLLLLARATTYQSWMSEYETLREQGFDLARRLQDQEALKAFRDEETFQNDQALLRSMPSLTRSLESGSSSSFPTEVLDAMIRQALRGKMSPAELERMLPVIRQQFLEEMGPEIFELLGDEDNDEDDDEDDEFSGFPFGPPPQSRKRKKKPSFLDLF